MDKHNLNFTAAPNDGRILAAAQYPNPKDDHLWLVMCEIGQDEYAVWTYNVQLKGYSSGQYFTYPGTAELNRSNATEYFVNCLTDTTDDYVNARMRNIQ